MASVAVTQRSTPAAEVPDGSASPATPGTVGPAVRRGLLAGVVAVFVVAVGLVEAFATNMVIDPILTTGYLALLAVPFGFGWFVGRDHIGPGGLPVARRSRSRLISGVVAGAVTAGPVIVFCLLFSVVDLQRLFVNITPILIDRLLLFSRGLAVGSVLLVAGGAALGLAGAAVHLVPDRWRRPVMTGLLWVFAAGVMQDLFQQVFRGLSLEGVVAFLYAPGGGLTLVGAAVVAIVIVAIDTLVASRREAVVTRVNGMTRTQRRAGAIVAVAVAVVVLALVPLVVGTFISEVLDLVGIYLLMALGLNIVVGYAGMLDLGYVAFFAVGAYATAVLTSPDSPTFSPEMVFWFALPFVVLAAALAGVLVGTPVLRMRGDYLAIVTLGFGEIARLLFQSDWLTPIFGGAQGITRIPGITVGTRVLSTPTEFFYPIVVLVLLTAYVSWALYNSRLGRAWTAIREDEPVAEALGINIVTAKLSAFVIGAVLASFGGAVFGAKIGAVFPNSFSIIVSIVVLVIIIVGGMGSIAGVAIGALIIQGIPQLLREFEEYQFLFYGALLIFMMLVKPEGLAPSRQRAQELHQSEQMQDAWLDAESERTPRDAPARARGRDPDAGLT